MAIKFFSLLLFLVTFFGCSKSLTKEEITNYVNEPDNKLSKTNEINGTTYTLSYYPHSLLSNALEEDSGSLAEYEKYYYFHLSIASSGKDALYASNNFQEFSENIQKFSFQLDQYVNLITDQGDTLALSDYNVPNLYGMAKNTQILLAFEKPKENVNELSILIKDLGLGTGIQKFSFLRKDLNDIPELKK